MAWVGGLILIRGGGGGDNPNKGWKEGRSHSSFLLEARGVAAPLTKEGRGKGSNCSKHWLNLCYVTGVVGEGGE